MHFSTRTWLVLAVVITVSLGLVGSSAAGQKCTWKVKLLDGPAKEDWYGTLANDISDTGLIGGSWFDENLGWHAAYWWKGKCYDLETECGIPSGTDQSNVMSINAKGLLAGYAYDGTNPYFQQAVLWNAKKETYTNLHPEDWDASLVYGINARGDCCGFVVEDPSTENGVLPYWVHAYVWPKNDRDGFTLPGTYDFLYSEAFGINSRGDVVGWGVVLGDAGFEFQALLWKKNWWGKYKLYNLHLKEIDGDTWIDSSALDITECGKVLGRVWDGKGVPAQPYEWTCKGGFELLDDGEKGEGAGVAWKGVGKYIAGGVGEGRTWLGQAISDSAAVWVKGKLCVVVDEKGDYKSFEASSVNRWGAAAGFAIMDDDEDDTTMDDMFPRGWVATKKAKKKCKGDDDDDDDDDEDDDD